MVKSRVEHLNGVHMVLQICVDFYTFENRDSRFFAHYPLYNKREVRVERGHNVPDRAHPEDSRRIGRNFVRMFLGSIPFDSTKFRKKLIRRGGANES